MLKGELFSTEMVLAYLEKRKLHTARPIKGIEGAHTFFGNENGLFAFFCGKYENGTFLDWEKDVKPKYRPGDFMYCRETWCTDTDMKDSRREEILNGFYFKADEAAWIHEGITAKWRSSIHMPRSAARLFFRVSRVEVMLLEDVTEQFAQEDGFWFESGYDAEEQVGYVAETAEEKFKHFWKNQYGAAARWMWVYWTEPVTKREALADGRS